MEIMIGTGIKEIIFGMYPDEVEIVWGIPDKINQEDDEQRIVYYYDNKMVKLIFDKEVDSRLYIIEVHHQEIKLFNENIFGRTKEAVAEFLRSNGYPEFEIEDYETFETFFCESIWTSFIFEFDKLMHVEFSPLFNDNDEIIWPEM